MAVDQYPRDIDYSPAFTLSMRRSRTGMNHENLTISITLLRATAPPPLSAHVYLRSLLEAFPFQHGTLLLPAWYPILKCWTRPISHNIDDRTSSNTGDLSVAGHVVRAMSLLFGLHLVSFWTVFKHS